MKTLSQFKADIIKKFGMTPPIAFWYRFVYEQYKKEMFDYDHALKRIGDMKVYNGV